jgi:hypothetical protein
MRANIHQTLSSSFVILTLNFVILSEAKDLLSLGPGEQQVLRFAQDDNH